MYTERNSFVIRTKYIIEIEQTQEFVDVTNFFIAVTNKNVATTKSIHVWANPVKSSTITKKFKFLFS